jgi:ABC-type multidrug transport system fused ATPase/permease subunit
MLFIIIVFIFLIFNVVLIFLSRRPSYFVRESRKALEEYRKVLNILNNEYSSSEEIEAARIERDRITDRLAELRNLPPLSLKWWF